MGRKNQKRQVRYTVALVGDGFTERIYFSDFRDTERPVNLHILPDYPGKIGSFKGVLERAVELSADYALVYALIDMDAVIAQRQQQSYASSKRAAERRGVIVLENNPCFEFWLLLHFRRTGRLFQNCEQAVTELRKHIPGYDKSMRFLEAARLFANLQERLAQAIMNAELLEENRDEHDELYPRAEIYKFFEWYTSYNNGN